MIGKGVRHINSLRQPELIKNCRYFNQLISDDLQLRTKYFETFFKRARGADLVFFDPDNGLGVKSIPKGRKKSSKYIYWDELEMSYKLGHSILIYQHFPRKERTSFINSLVQRFITLQGLPSVISYCTPYVAFLLLPQPRDKKYFLNKTLYISEKW